MSWPIVAITECARVVGGATPKSKVAEYWDGHIPWATPKDLSELDSQFIDDTPRKITQFGLSKCSAEVLPAGSVLFSSRAPIGHVAINRVPMATNQGFKSMIPGPNLNAGFLYWWLVAHKEQLQAMGTGATFKEVSKAVVERIEIPLPPLEEQRRIAAILDQADALRRLRHRTLTHLNTLAQSIFHEMFGDLASPDAGVQTKQLGSYVDPARPITYGILKPGDDLPEGVPYVRVVDMAGENIGVEKLRRTSREIAAEYKRSTLKPGDLLMSIRGHVGRTAIVPPELDGANITQDTARLAVPANQAEYFRHCILHPRSQHWMAQRTRGIAVRGINLGDLKELPIPDYPNDMKYLFAERIRTVRANIEKRETAHDASEILFTSLQHRAFRGEL